MDKVERAKLRDDVTEFDRGGRDWQSRGDVEVTKTVLRLLDALDAADREIERLRDENAAAWKAIMDGNISHVLRPKLRDYEAALKDARAENTALRKVIAEAASLNNSDDIGARRETARILAEALGGQPT